MVSSQLDGTQATLVDLLTFEADSDDGPASADVGEVCDYLDALNFARTQLTDTAGLPLSMRLLNETHARLMQGVRGADKQPGEVRRTQNWIGGSRPGNAALGMEAGEPGCAGATECVRTSRCWAPPST